MRKSQLVLSLAALGSSLVLAASLTLPASAATGTTGSSASPLIATGTATNASGGAASGAVVRLYAWPSDKVLQHLRPGQVVPRTLLASTRASSEGTYSFHASPAALRSAAVSGGYANLEADSGMASWFFTRKASAGAPVIHVNLTGAAPARHCSGWVFKYRSTRPGASSARDTYGLGRPALTSISPTPRASPAPSALEPPRQARQAASRRLAPRRRPRPAPRECPASR